QSNHDSRHYIYSWKAKKMDNGYNYRECYTEEEYKVLLYSIFGTVENIEIVPTNKFAYMKTTMQYTEYKPITPTTYERHYNGSASCIKRGTRYREFVHEIVFIHESVFVHEIDFIHKHVFVHEIVFIHESIFVL